ncbi:MAG: hypothetical protein WEF28_02930 [Acidimicrobiia bacterium]
MISLTAVRIRPEPLVSPHSVPGYGPIFNAGLIHHEGRFYLFARGVRDGYRRSIEAGPRFVDYRSDVLLFSSEDGMSYTFEKVLAAGSDEGVWSCRGSSGAAGRRQRRYQPSPHDLYRSS